MFTVTFTSQTSSTTPGGEDLWSTSASWTLFSGKPPEEGGGFRQQRRFSIQRDIASRQANFGIGQCSSEEQFRNYHQSPQPQLQLWARVNLPQPVMGRRWARQLGLTRIVHHTGADYVIELVSM